MQSQNGSQLQVYRQQVSGKEPKLLSDDHTKLLKGFNIAQRDFYLEISSFHISHPFAAICRHIPKYFGVLELNADPKIKLQQQNHEKNTLTWLNHLTQRYKVRNQSNKFILLQNLTYRWETPNIFDIKIGGRNVQGKKHKITKSVSHLFLKLNGCKMHFPQQNQSIFLSKYYLAEIVETAKIIDLLGLFFFDGYQIHLQALRSIVQKLIDLILSFKALRGYKFISSSLCIMYDAKQPLNADAKLLDFGRVSHCDPEFIDEDSISGLVNIHRFLSDILKLGQKNSNIYKELQSYYRQTELTVIPQKKKIKYNHASDNSPTRN